MISRPSVTFHWFLLTKGADTLSYQRLAIIDLNRPRFESLVARYDTFSDFSIKINLQLKSLVFWYDTLRLESLIGRQSLVASR